MRLRQGTPKFPLLYFRKASTINKTNLYEHDIILLIRSGGLNINNYFLVPQTKD